MNLDNPEELLTTRERDRLIKAIQDLQTVQVLRAKASTLEGEEAASVEASAAEIMASINDDDLMPFKRYMRPAIPLPAAVSLTPDGLTIVTFVLDMELHDCTQCPMSCASDTGPEVFCNIGSGMIRSDGEERYPAECPIRPGVF